VSSLGYLLSSRKESRPIKNKDILGNIIILFTRIQILCSISKGKTYVQDEKKINIKNWAEQSQRE
jgi:hypothetical protein